MPDTRVGRTAGISAVVACVIAGCAAGGSSTLEKDRVGHTAAEIQSDVSSLSPPSQFPRGYHVVESSPPPVVAVAKGFDIVHGAVEVSFDLSTPDAAGEATYTFVVQRNGLSDLRFRSEGLRIENVELSRGGVRLQSEFVVDGPLLMVMPGSPLKRADTLSTLITYRSATGSEPNSGAIRFVDPATDDPSLPTQVWCCENAQANARWVPDPDDPGDLMTFELRLSMHDSLTSIASGELVEQIFLDSGFRTDHWVVEAAQPSRQIGFAVSRFALIADDYVSPVGKRMPLVFAVEPSRERLVDAVFATTRDMLAAVERRTAVEYPFDDYKQVIVSNHSGMASTLRGISIFDSKILRDDRALIDAGGEEDIMRGLASQWYGGWVGVGDEAQRPLMNGFVRLFEAFYAEDRAGRQGLEEDLLRARQHYFAEAATVRRPVLVRGAEHAVSRDAHSVDKPALVLYQLGGVLGEDAWWRGLRDFTARGGRRAVTIDDLRESMEQAARRNLSEYFDQWFLEPGHPEMLVDHDYDPGVGVYSLRLRQVQDSLRFPTYRIETNVSIQFESAPEYTERISINTRDTTLRIGVSGRVSYVRLDRGKRLLADVRERKPMEQWLLQALIDESVGGRYDAVTYLSGGVGSTEKRDALMRVASEDPSALLRAAALHALSRYTSSGLVIRFLFDRSRSDPAAQCRVAALEALVESGDPSAVGVFREALFDPSYAVVATAISALGNATPSTFWRTVEPLTTLESWDSVVERAILGVLERTPTAQSEAYLRRLMEPTRSARVRVAALNAFKELSTLGDGWRSTVRMQAQLLLSDRNAEVREQARRVLRDLDQ